uniref:PROP1-like PPR domain-containing protein n=1 Tax=Chromera velia CCMP2878 TaxID=1169474 RepID=A0A0G4IEK5_9ALVE|eukprot:Cvel_13663.t1-p1 / transcript=Cvel_13663.t1 / gene=Cvel_13663 / organism=Chromera_velia_CCMP2878 / gene_product=Pentatricopeptide repeat-containing protein, putative / transcript_product=Pentatricopeptide repeat-containing protein, putative / location=Cvel_scaffold943:26941-29797(-) / protein_length=735 / sequence_SO=supercontig / SO=protein_coding / is_pseudo=false
MGGRWQSFLDIALLLVALLSFCSQGGDCAFVPVDSNGIIPVFKPKRFCDSQRHVGIEKTPSSVALKLSAGVSGSEGVGGGFNETVLPETALLGKPVPTRSYTSLMFNPDVSGHTDSDPVSPIAQALKRLEAFSLHEIPFKPSLAVYKQLLVPSVQTKEISLPGVLSLFEEMKANGLTPDQHVYTMLLLAFAKAAGCEHPRERAALFDRVLLLFAEMRKNGIKPDPAACYLLIKLASSLRSLSAWQRAHACLSGVREEGVEPPTCIWNELLSGAAAIPEVPWEKVWKTYQEMVLSGATPNETTFFALSLVFARSGRSGSGKFRGPHRAQALLEEMVRHEVQPKERVFEGIVVGLSTSHRKECVQSAREVLHVMKSRQMEPSYRALSAILSACIHSRDAACFADFLDVFQEMRQRKMVPSARMYREAIRMRLIKGYMEGQAAAAAEAARRPSSSLSRPSRLRMFPRSRQSPQKQQQQQQGDERGKKSSEKEAKNSGTDETAVRGGEGHPGSSGGGERESVSRENSVEADGRGGGGGSSREHQEASEQIAEQVAEKVSRSRHESQEGVEWDALAASTMSWSAEASVQSVVQKFPFDLVSEMREKNMRVGLSTCMWILVATLFYPRGGMGGGQVEGGQSATMRAIEELWEEMTLAVLRFWQGLGRPRWVAQLLQRIEVVLQKLEMMVPARLQWMFLWWQGAGGVASPSFSPSESQQKGHPGQGQKGQKGGAGRSCSSHL